MKLPNVVKSDMSITLIKQLNEKLPVRETLPPYLLVDDDVYEALIKTLVLYPDNIDEDYIGYAGWKVISRSMICELG